MTQVKFVGDKVLFSGNQVTFNAECCCCGCTTPQIRGCRCLNEDFGAFQTPKSIQVDVNVTPYLKNSTTLYNMVNDSRTCYSPYTTIECPNLNGSYILSPAYMDPVGCWQKICKRTYTEICTAYDYPFYGCFNYTPAAGLWHLVIIGTITVEGYLVWYDTSPMITVGLGSTILWVHDDEIGNINVTNTDCRPFLDPKKARPFPGCGYPGAGRTVKFRWPMPTKYKFYGFEPSETCLPTCNTVYEWYSCNWSSTPDVEDVPDRDSSLYFGSTIPIYGCNYNGGSITAIQV